MSLFRNIFTKIVGDASARESRLGNPLGDQDAIARRKNHFALMTGGNGFRQPSKKDRPAKVSKGGLTRAEIASPRRARSRENMLAEVALRERMRDAGASIRDINRAIERGEHIKKEKAES